MRHWRTTPLTYANGVATLRMVFIETAVFERQVAEHLQDDEYAALQDFLSVRPDAGHLIVGGSGLRKVRWSLPGSGKRGGIRVIYVWRVRYDQIHLQYMFTKREASDLTREQIRQLGEQAKKLT